MAALAWNGIRQAGKEPGVIPFLEKNRSVSADLRY